jgi:3'(2'), 5'-bisphosphate nucleotidase
MASSPTALKTTPPAHYAALLPDLLPVVREAGAAIKHHYDSALAAEFSRKADDSPITAADLAAHAVLKRGLSPLGDAWPVLSEESSERSLRGRRSWSRFWLVDPLDGTREFLKRSGEFTVNVALIDGQRPVLGVIHVPVSGETYFGVPGHEALKLYPGGEQTILTRPLLAGEPLVWLGGPTHIGSLLSGCVDWLHSRHGSVERVNAGSALKFCRLAAGVGDLYPRFWPCCEWDTAAGQALVEAAGGVVVDLQGRPLRYNRSESLHSPHFLAIADPQAPLWQSLQRERHLWYPGAAAV